MPQDLLEEDYREPYTAWRQDASPQAAGALLKALDPIITQNVKQHGAMGGPVLHVQARQMALDALPRYDPSKASLGTFLRHQLRGLHRLAQRRIQPIRVPERVALERQYLHRATAELTDQFGREPSDLELADHLHLPLARLARLRSAAPPSLAEGSLDVGGAEDSPNEPAMLRGTGDEDPWLDFVYRSLEARDQIVLDHTLGRHGRARLSNQDLARKLGVTPAAISQRKLKIERMLAERDQLNVL